MSPLDLVSLPSLIKLPTGRSDIAVGLIDGPVAITQQIMQSGKKVWIGLLAPFAVVVATATPAAAQQHSPAQGRHPADFNRETLEQRAVTAAIWGMPIVSVYAMRQAYFRDAKANYGDIVFWSKPSDWKNQTNMTLLDELAA